MDLHLRDIEADDLPIFYEHQLDPEATRLAAFTSRDRESFMAHWDGILGDGTIAKRTIVIDGRVAGNVVSFERDGDLEVGYWIGREYWGKGVATGALSQFLDEVRTRPLRARVATHNVGSIRVLEKCGFAVIGHETGLPDANGKQVEEVLLQLDGQEVAG